MRKQIGRPLAATLLGGLIVVLAARAAPPKTAGPMACEPGYMIVEEICYQEVVKKVCKVVPEIKKVKRRVYSTKEEDYCLKKCPCPLGCLFKNCDGCCLLCGQPRCRTVLLKKEVEEEVHDYKCVVEEVVELVPYKVYRKVPCPRTETLPPVVPR